MISLRLSDEEYEVVTSASRINGARTLSEFARAAMLQLSNSQRRMDPVVGSLEEITRRVDMVYHEVRKVVTVLCESPSQSAALPVGTLETGIQNSPRPAVVSYPPSDPQMNEFSEDSGEI